MLLPSTTSTVTSTASPRRRLASRRLETWSLPPLFQSRSLCVYPSLPRTAVDTIARESHSLENLKPNGYMAIGASPDTQWKATGERLAKPSTRTHS
ncbi:hypothetical protein KC354_g58 [Hortaea werneckii]|nr:hypothetical protein KC354_g58 [Hortaea werneckii]